MKRGLVVRDPAALERRSLIRAVMCDFQVELSEARGRGWCEGGPQRASARMRRSSSLRSRSTERGLTASSSSRMAFTSVSGDD